MPTSTVPPLRQQTIWNTAQLPVNGRWGPVTATIDWCEANYDCSYYIAEFMNTITNAIFFACSSYGVHKGFQQRLPTFLVVPHISMLCVALGSALFHATLIYEFQLLDELPMLASAATGLYAVFQTRKQGEPPIIPHLQYILAAAVLIVSVIYIQLEKPVFHEVVYGVIMLSSVVRVVYLVHTELQDGPLEAKIRRQASRTLIQGTAMFLLGFVVWNLDNIFCSANTRLKGMVGKPLSFMLELHGWWHLLTGYGGYFIIAGSQLLIMAIREGAHKFEYGGSKWLPYVRRLEKKK